MSSESLALSLFFHLTATVIWIGGLLITMLLVWPTMRRSLEETPTLFHFLSGIRRRFYPISNLALAVLIVTGLFQMTASTHYDGFMTFSNTWSKIMLLKHIVVGLMAVTGLLLQYAVAPTLERTSLLLQHQKGESGDIAQWRALHRQERLLTWLNGVLGLLVLAFSAWLGVL